MVTFMLRKLGGNWACGRVLCLGCPHNLVQELNTGTVDVAALRRLFLNKKAMEMYWVLPVCSLAGLSFTVYPVIYCITCIFYRHFIFAIFAFPMIAPK